MLTRAQGRNRGITLGKLSIFSLLAQDFSETDSVIPGTYRGGKCMLSVALISQNSRHIYVNSCIISNIVTDRHRNCPRFRYKLLIMQVLTAIAV